MANDKPVLSRRDVLTKSGSIALSGAVIGLAGCQGTNGNSTGGNGNSTGGNTNTSANTNTSGNGYSDLSDISMTFATTFEPSHVQNRALEIFKEKIETETNNKFTVDIVPGGAYGGVDEINEMVSRGGIEGTSSGSTAFSMYAPEWSFWGTPFVMKDWDQLNRMTDSDMWKNKIIPTFIDNGGLRPVGNPIYRGVRYFSANKPVKHPDDVQGMKLRIPDLEDRVRVWNKIGANVTPVALTELYSAHETGVIDGSTDAYSQFYGQSLYEVVSHYSFVNELVEAGHVYVNENFLQGLDETYRELVLQYSAEATQEASKWSLSQETDQIKSLESEHDVTVVRDVDNDAFRSAAEPAIKALFQGRFEPTLKEARSL